MLAPAKVGGRVDQNRKAPSKMHLRTHRRNGVIIHQDDSILVHLYCWNAHVSTSCNPHVYRQIPPSHTMVPSPSDTMV